MPSWIWTASLRRGSRLGNQREMACVAQRLPITLFIRLCSSNVDIANRTMFCRDSAIAINVGRYRFIFIVVEHSHLILAICDEASYCN